MNTQINELQTVITLINAEIIAKKNAIHNFEYSCTEREYNDFLDQIYGEVNICGITYSASRALKNLDPIAYRCSKSDYESNFDLENCAEYIEKRDELEQLQNELEQLQDELDDLENEAE